MGYGFRARCPDCSHEWEGISTSAWLDPFPPGKSLEEFRATLRSWCCPSCCHNLYLPRVIDFNAWKKFRARLTDSTPYLKFLASRIENHLDPARPYIPTLVDLNPGDCPRCGEPFVEGEDEFIALICPNCRARNAIQMGGDSHYDMERDDFGFG